MYSANQNTKSLFYSIIFLLFFLFCFTGLQSQNFQFRTYSFNNGLSSYNAGKIIQDKFGFIWVATQEGINRFDGKDFLTVKKDPIANKGLNENYITDVAADKDGKLWIASALGGVDVLNPENLAIEKRLNAGSIRNPLLITNWVRCLAWSAQNELWIGTYYGFNVYNKNSNTSIAVKKNPFTNKQDLNICFAGADSMHNMWLAVENEGIVIYNSSSKKLIARLSKEDLGINSYETFCVKNLYIDAANSVYVCSNKGVKHILIIKGEYVFSNEKNLFNKISSTDIRCIIKNNNQIWIGTEKGIEILTDNDFTIHVKHSNFFYNSILDDNINSLFKDSFGNIWATTTKGVNLLINNQFHFRGFTAKSGMMSEMNAVHTLYADNDSTIYACTETGLFETNIKTFSSKEILPAGQYGAIDLIIRINKDGFLVSANQGLLFLKKTDTNFSVISAADVFKELSPVQFNYFSSCLKYNDSILLLASMEDEGLIKWNIKQHTLKQFKNIYNKLNSPGENNFHNIKQDKRGNIWLMSNNSITKYDVASDVFTNYFPTNKHQSLPHFFFDMYDDGNYLWLTSYGYGLVRFNLQYNSYIFYTEKNGFSSNATYNIVNENDSIIWVSSNKGLTRFNTKTGKTSAYYLNDGLQSDAFDERSACKIGNSIFFGGIDGFTEISKNTFFSSAAKAPVYIGKIIYTDKNGKMIEINTLNASGLQFKNSPISFKIITPDYPNNSRISYAYKIEEINNEWIALGKNNQITLASLSPGSYHFQGRIYNADNITVDSKIIEFTILPEWYQTLVFKLALIVFVLAIAYSFYRYRINQIKTQQKRLHQVREEIASDLHDDIGSTLNGIKIFAHIAEQTPDNKKYFEQIKQSLKCVSESLRDMIWVLDDSNDTAEELMKRIQFFMKPVAEASGINIDFIIEGIHAALLNKKEKRNLLMIAKEAVNNSIKYADCKNITVVFKSNNENRVLTIQDDGKGFVEEDITPGNGLKNMHTRAEQIGYLLVMKTGLGEGTVIKADLKL